MMLALARKKSWKILEILEILESTKILNAFYFSHRKVRTQKTINHFIWHWNTTNRCGINDSQVFCLKCLKFTFLDSRIFQDFPGFFSSAAHILKNSIWYFENTIFLWCSSRRPIWHPIITGKLKISKCLAAPKNWKILSFLKSKISALESQPARKKFEIGMLNWLSNHIQRSSSSHFPMVYEWSDFCTTSKFSNRCFLWTFSLSKKILENPGISWKILENPGNPEKLCFSEFSKKKKVSQHLLFGHHTISLFIFL